MPTDLDDPEDAKIVALARSARARTGAAEGACVRDRDGRTYAAASVDLPSLQLSALQVAVATAVSSGSRTLEAAAVVRGPGHDASQSRPPQLSEADLRVVRDVGGTGVRIFVAAPDGSLLSSSTS
jgi:hypothetical protein